MTGPDRTRAVEQFEAAPVPAVQVPPTLATPSGTLATAVAQSSVPLGAVAELQAGGNAAVTRYIARSALDAAAPAVPDPAAAVGQPVGKYARVGEVDPFLSVRSAMDPRRVTTLPDPLVVDSLNFNDRVFVLEQHAGNWAKIRTDRGQIGYAYADKLFIGAPEPQARLHKIKSGETALRIAQNTYNCGEWGRDGRFFVNVLVAVNQSGDQDPRRGIYMKQGGDPGAIDSWKDAELRADYWVWLPSEAFARSLGGTVSSGSASYEGWQAVKGVAGFAVGVVEGIGAALVDLVMGVVDLVSTVVEQVIDVARNGIAAKIQQMRDFLDKLDVAEIASAIWSDFTQRWNASDSYDRWEFRGYVVGMALAEIAMAVLTGGATAVAKIAAKAGKLAKLLAKLLKLDEVWDFVRGVEKVSETTEAGRDARKLLRGHKPDADAPHGKGGDKTPDKTPDPELGGGETKLISKPDVVDPQLDNNLLSALANPKDPGHAAAVAYVTANKDAGLSVGRQAYREFLEKRSKYQFSQLREKYGIRLIRELDLPEIESAGKRIQQAFSGTDRVISAEDARVAATAYLRNEKLATNDLKFYKRAKDLGLDVEYVGSGRAAANARDYVPVPVKIPD